MEKFEHLTHFFNEHKKYWYIIPRAQYFNDENLREFHSVLTFFRKFQSVKVKELKNLQSNLWDNLKPNDLVLRVWDKKTQMKVQKKMIKDGIINPFQNKKQTENDQLANFRNHINLCKKLGFAYFNHLKHLYISEMGERFLEADPKDWKTIIEEQIQKIQFWNPSLRLSKTDQEQKEYKDYKVFPYFYVLELLLTLKEKNLTVEEYVTVGKKEKAKEFIDSEKDVEKKIILQEQFHKLMLEKEIEEMLEKNISLLGEPNLKIVKKWTTI